MILKKSGIESIKTVNSEESVKSYEIYMKCMQEMKLTYYQYFCFNKFHLLTTRLNSLYLKKCLFSEVRFYLSYPHILPKSYFLVSFQQVVVTLAFSVNSDLLENKQLRDPLCRNVDTHLTVTSDKETCGFKMTLGGRM